MSRRQRNYDREYAQYHAKPEQKKRRAARNKGRKLAEKEAGRDLPRNVEVHHKDGNPQNNHPSNRTLMRASKNRRIQPNRKRRP